MALSYEQKNPRSIMRDLLVDPGPSVAKGYAYPQAFGLPVGGESVASGRSIDLSGSQAALSGTLLVRSQRDMLGAAAEVSKIGKPVGSPRDLVEQFALGQINFDMKQFGAEAYELIANIDHGFGPDEELYLAKTCAQSVHTQVELYTKDFFSALNGEAATSATTGGWAELDWQGGTLSGAAIGTSTNAISALHRAVMATRLAGASEINLAIIPQGVFERLQRDAELLGRIQNGAGWAVSGNAVASPDAAISVLKEHLGFSEVIIAAGAHTTQKRGEAYSASANNAYIWPVDRMWIGNSGDMDVKLNAKQPKVLNDAGAFGCLYSKVFEEDLGFPENVGPQHVKCTVTTALEMVALSPEKGAIIHNMD